MEVSNKSRLVAFLLAFFLGCFGAHRYYLGRIGTAIAMTILTCTIVGWVAAAVWAFIDWIMIVCGSMKDGEGKIVQDWSK